MPKINRTYTKRLDPRAPLVFDTRTLRPGSMRTEERTAAAPADLGAGMIGIPAGADLQLQVRLEGVSEGTLVTATVTAPLAGECARCLEEFTSSIRVRLQELYTWDDDPDVRVAGQHLVQHVQPLVHREQPVLGHVGADRDHDLVVQPGGAADDVQMPVGNRVE